MKQIMYSVLAIALLALAACSKLTPVEYALKPDTYRVWVNIVSDKEMELYVNGAKVAEGQNIKWGSSKETGGEEGFEVFDPAKPTQLKLTFKDEPEFVLTKESSTDKATDLEWEGQLDSKFKVFLDENFLEEFVPTKPTPGNIVVAFQVLHSEFKPTEPVDLHVVRQRIDEGTTTREIVAEQLNYVIGEVSQEFILPVADDGKDYYFLAISEKGESMQHYAIKSREINLESSGRIFRKTAYPFYRGYSDYLDNPEQRQSDIIQFAENLVSFEEDGTVNTISMTSTSLRAKLTPAEGEGN